MNKPQAVKYIDPHVRRLFMEQNQFITNPSHQKGKHLNFEERVVIQTRLRDGWAFRKIAREIGCSANTVRNEYSRGKVLLYNGKIERYVPTTDKQNMKPTAKIAAENFSHRREKNFFATLWKISGKIIGHRCLRRSCPQARIFKREEIVCTKTLYNYVSLGLLNPIKNIDLPLKVRRKNSSAKVRSHKKKLGRSIEERDKKINDREEFGHLECDLIVGNRSDDDVILNIVERKTRYSFVYRLPNKEVRSVMKAFDDFKNLFGENFDKVFHTITTDNGSEFSSLADLEKVSKILVYFAQPYSSWEKGTVENLNGLFRRFIPKGKSIRDFSAECISNLSFGQTLYRIKFLTTPLLRNVSYRNLILP